MNNEWVIKACALSGHARSVAVGLDKEDGRASHGRDTDENNGANIG